MGHARDLRFGTTCSAIGSQSGRGGEVFDVLAADDDPLRRTPDQAPNDRMIGYAHVSH
jgi:hypothetical protein